VPKRKKYRLPDARSSPASNFRYWLLTLALATIVGWLWWQTGTRPRPLSPLIGPPVKLAPAEPVTPRQPAGSARSAPTPIPAPMVVPQIPAPAPAPTQPVAPVAGFPRPVQNVLEAQLALVGHGISPGSLDGAMGSQTRAALMAFQRQTHLPVTAELDASTRDALFLTRPPYTSFILASNDLARLQPLAPTWVGKSQQTGLDFETALELVAEKTFTHPNLIKRLNPNIDWANVPPGTAVQVPNGTYPDPPAKAAFVFIHLASRTLEAFDSGTNLLAHFPCSIAQHVDKRPVGELHVAVIAPNPNYTFDPDIFPESPEAQQLNHKLVLPPGPNNPVGVAWIGLDKPGYGIHGTPKPEEVGRTESHGCFRLANWNAEYLLRLVAVGTPVYVVE